MPAFSSVSRFYVVATSMSFANAFYTYVVQRNSI